MSITIRNATPSSNCLFSVFMWRQGGHVGEQNNSEKSPLGIWWYYNAKRERHFAIVLYTDMAVSSRENQELNDLVSWAFSPSICVRLLHRWSRKTTTYWGLCHDLVKRIHWMHKWRLNDYSFTWMLIRLTSLIFVWKFFCIFRMLTRLVRLISTKIKE